MKNRVIIFCIIGSLLLFTSCKKDENNIDSTESDREAIILARPASVDDWYFNKYQERKSNEIINAFNSTNDKYFIQERPYETSDKFLLDVISGQQFDLLYVGDWLNITPLYGKEMLCDIYELIDSDSDTSRDEYVGPVLNSLEINGKLYQMPYDFIVQSAVAKTDLWGNDIDNSFEHILEKSEQLGCDMPFDLSVYSYSFIPFISSEFIDFESGTCCFDDGRFEEVLVLMKKYNDIYGKVSQNYPNGALDLFKENRVLLMSSEFAGFQQLDYITWEAGGRVKYVGFPSDTSNYHIAVPIVSFSVFKSTDKKQGAFEFIKYYTSYNSYIYDMSSPNIIAQSSACIPINKAAVEYLANESIEDDLNNFYKFDEQTRIENRDDILNQIYTVNGSNNPVGNIVKDILTEEIQPYLDGRKTASEVCDMIQNRLTTYFDEQWDQ